MAMEMGGFAKVGHHQDLRHELPRGRIGTLTRLATWKIRFGDTLLTLTRVTDLICDVTSCRRCVARRSIEPFFAENNTMTMVKMRSNIILSLISLSALYPAMGFSPVLSSMNQVAASSSLAASTMKELAERVLTNPKFPPEWPYSPSDFERQDESDDSIFYDSPRLVYHIDDYAVTALTEYYARNLQDGDDVLDICSSWVSHYPKTWKGGNVVGLGMNEYELSQNKQLSSYVVRDLNNEPTFPFESNSFDKVTCVVSVDYLNQPKKIFDEIARVLRPGGECIISMSNRCFPTKAFRIWLQTSDLEHIFIVGSFFHYSGQFEPASCEDISPNPGRSDPMFIVKAVKKSAV